MIDECTLKKWEEQCASACEGPWRVSNIKDKNYYPDGVLSLRGKDDVEICGPIAKEDARFMATAREAMPLLIARVRELEADLQYADHFRTDCIKACEQVAQLEKEADWLAKYATGKSPCIKPLFDCREAGQINQCHICLRDVARKAVQNAD